MSDWGKRLKKYEPKTFERINQENLAAIEAYQDMVEKTYGTRPTVEEVFEAILDKYTNREHKIELEVPEYGKLALKKVNKDHLALLEAACETTQEALGRKPDLAVAADQYLTKFFARDSEYLEFIAKGVKKAEKPKDKPAKVAKTEIKAAAVKPETSTPTPAPKPEPTTTFGSGSGSGFGTGTVSS